MWSLTIMDSNEEEYHGYCEAHITGDLEVGIANCECLKINEHTGLSRPQFRKGHSWITLRVLWRWARVVSSLGWRLPRHSGGGAVHQETTMTRLGLVYCCRCHGMNRINRTILCCSSSTPTWIPAFDPTPTLNHYEHRIRHGKDKWLPF